MLVKLPERLNVTGFASNRSSQANCSHSCFFMQRLPIINDNPLLEPDAACILVAT